MKRRSICNSEGNALQTDLTLGIVLTVRSDWSWSLEFRVEQHMENWLFTHEVSSITEVVIEFLISFRWLLWTIAIDHLQSHENIKLLFVLRRKTILCDGVLKTIILRGGGSKTQTHRLRSIQIPHSKDYVPYVNQTWL